ncbi:MAG: LacI family transcriptional regulator [Proteobacteria bacterium]|nr:LacI family transcriptional regulator [Pseudomonadota bacterium]
MPVTIQDISRHLGLSVSAVSKALNDYDDISEGTKQRVRDAAEELGYTPSAAARNLRRQRTDKIGFSYGFPTTYIGEFASRLINGAVVAAEKEGYNLTLYPLTESRFDQLLRISRSREVDGLLLMGGEDWEETIELLKRERVPFVVLNRRVDDPEISYVTSDDVDGYKQLTEHMLNLDHKRIAYVTRSGLRLNNDRLAGYHQALSSAGVPYDESLVVFTDMAPGTAYKAAKRLLSMPDPPTAFVTIHDAVAIECVQAATDRGLYVPDDVAVAGCDNIRESLTANPPLTTLHPPLAEIGRLATEALLARVVGPSARVTRLTLPSKLIIRRSTAVNPTT